MNNTLNTTGGFLSDKIGGFGGLGYGIGVSVGILLLITTITLASYFCTRINTHQQHSSSSNSSSQSHHHHLHLHHHHHLEPANNSDEHSVVIEMGLDEATLLSYPKLLYSKAKLINNKDSTATCCSICLADYKGTDMLRMLPDCGHLFHLKCVDPWLRLHPTCPVCRTTPVPTPTSTPLSTPSAEVIPFASRMIRT